MWYICQAYITNHIIQYKYRAFNTYIYTLDPLVYISHIRSTHCIPFTNFIMRHTSLLLSFVPFWNLRVTSTYNNIAFINATALMCNICLHTQLGNPIRLAIESLKFCKHFANFRSFKILKRIVSSRCYQRST